MTEVRRERHLEERETKMKKKIFSILLIAVLVLASVGTAFAQEVATGQEGTGSITIENAAKGETYGLIKLFDATVSADGKAINYTGDIPSDLAAYFTKDAAGNISKAEGKSDDEVAKAVADWAQKQAMPAKPMSEESNGESLTFTGLKYGYYAIKSSQGNVVTVDSTTPDATVYDKNSKEVTADKKVEKESYSIGDTVKYTGTFDTANYMGEGAAAKQVVKYEISDTLPEYLSNATITEVTVGGVKLDPTPSFSDKKFEIEWATKNDDGTYTSKYANGAQIVVRYEAVLTDVVNINTANTNTITIQPYVDNGGDTPEPWSEKWSDDEIIKTYAAALKKTDKEGKTLSGAQFTIKGLQVKPGDAKGEYIVVSYNPDSDVQSDVLDTNDEGMLYIVGLVSDADLTSLQNQRVVSRHSFFPQRFTQKAERSNMMQRVM